MFEWVLKTSLSSFSEKYFLALRKIFRAREPKYQQGLQVSWI